MPRKSKEKGRAFENKVAKTVGSGNLWFSPGDLKTDSKIIEVKYTDQKGFRVTLNILDKLWNQSLDMGKEPHLVIGIKRNDSEIYLLNCDITVQRK